MNRPPALPNLSETDREQFWPALPFTEWQATAETLHMWTQIVGKIRLALTPWINHSWHVTLYLTPFRMDFTLSKSGSISSVMNFTS